MNGSSLLADVSLSAAVTGVISITARGFRMYNLACGAWVVLGGWAWHCLTSSTGSQVHAHWFLLIAAVAVLHIALPRLLSRSLPHEPASYVFATLGVALAVFGPRLWRLIAP